ncbi:Regulatory protein afsR [Actinoplanes sp. SE50]|nr:Regulatory protein afsR [Actinoplanes sp. SE50/110]ATO82431.1 Regulatory protein afsR [Actinoplanes sp. SE50]SLL99838.1 hypothetical protein ACSP50_3070 [Actinoplanes sp. SE50/110]
MHREPGTVRLWIRRLGAVTLVVMPVAFARIVSASAHSDGLFAWLALFAGYLVGVLGIGLAVVVSRQDGPRPPVPLVPRELPAVPPLLLGRADRVGEAVAYLSAATGPAVRTVVIAGAPGIGKTAVALFTAHRVAARYPDGQLFATLDARGRDPDEMVRRTLIRFLLALGHPAERAAGLDVCRQEFQRMSAGKRLLVVLDDVHGLDPQPLIPAGAGSAVLLTSPQVRPGRAPHLLLPLEPLADRDAVALLAQIVGEQRVRDSLPAATALARACAGLPLALQIAGQALVARPSADMSVVLSRADVASGDSRPTERGRDPRSVEPGHDPRRWALNVSYELLSRGDRDAVLSLGRLSRRFEPWMLAAETNLDEDQARSLADRLSATQFVERWTADAAGVPVYETVEHVQDFARLRAGGDRPAPPHPRPRTRDPLDEQRIHTYDLLDKGSLVAADVNVREVLDRARQAGDQPGVGKALAALAELRAELGGTDEVVDLAEQAWQHQDPGIRARVYRVMGHIQRRVRQLDVAERNLSRALRHAGQAGDEPEQIRVLTELALVHRLGGRAAQALEHTGRAMALAEGRRDGGIRYRSRILLAEGMTLIKLSRYAEAEQRFADARAAADRAGYRLWRQWVDYRDAQLHVRSGDAVRAQDLAIAALAGFTGIRHRYGTGHCRLLLGRIHADAGQYAAARTVIEDALETFRNCGDRFIEGHAAAELASVHLREGSLAAAADALRRAKQLKTGQRYWQTSLRLTGARLRRMAGGGAPRRVEPIAPSSPVGW